MATATITIISRPNYRRMEIKQTLGIDGEMYDPTEYIDVVYPRIKEQARKVHAFAQHSEFLTAFYSDNNDLTIDEYPLSSLIIGPAEEDFEIW